MILLKFAYFLYRLADTKYKSRVVMVVLKLQMTVKMKMRKSIKKMKWSWMQEV